MDWKTMLNRFKRDERSMLGIDISSTAVKIMEISQNENNLCLEGFDSELLPPNAIEGHTLKDVDAVARTIKQLVSCSPFKSKIATLAVPDSAVISKILSVNDNFSDAEIEEFILMEADRHIPYPIEDVSVDFHILGPSLKNNRKLDVLMVASRSENVASRVQAVEKAGLEVKIVEVESFAIERAMQLMASELPLPSKDKIIAVINIGEELTSLYILQNLKIIYTHQSEFGTKSFMEKDRQHHGVNKATNPFIERLLSQVKRGLQFSVNAADLADCIVIGGDVTELAELAFLIERHTKIPTVIANPAKYLRLNKQITNAPSWLIASGLALRNAKYL